MAAEPSAITMNVSLPLPLKLYVDGKVSSGIYGSASEFVREAIREKFQRDQDRQEGKAELTAKLLDGLSSGEPIPLTEAYFKGKKKALAAKIGRMNKRS
jgi:antitoxin ParD1/3/4